MYLREEDRRQQWSSGFALRVAILGGEVHVGFINAVSVVSHVKTGKVRALGISSTRRSSLLPDVPTVAESGLPGFDAVLTYGIVAPVGTPRPIVERLNRELRAALAMDDVRRRLIQEGAEPLPTTPEEYAAIIDREETKWSTLIKSVGIKIE